MSLNFFRGYALGMSGNLQQSIRELEQLMRKREVAYPAILALLHMHRSSSMVDRQEIEGLEISLKTAAESVSDNGCLLSATFHLHTGDIYEARKFVQRVLPPGRKPQTALEIQAAR